METLNLDYESYSEIDLKVHGLDVYSAHPSTEILMASYSFNGGSTELWTKDDGPFPAILRDALADPHVRKKAFNAQFERVMSRRVLKIDTKVRNWRCTMAKAYLLSFIGGLGDIGEQIGLPLEMQKMKEGRRLIQLFCKPQRVTKTNPFKRRDSFTDENDWQIFGDYCVQDTDTEMAIDRRLEPYFIPEDEWDFYELDQLINDRGLPLDLDFIRNAMRMADIRKRELVGTMKELTGLANPNSQPQLLPWLRKRGYPFRDLRKDTVAKVLREVDSDTDPDLVAALNLRKQASRTSDRKYNTMMKAVGDDGRVRFCYQFAGASRTARFAGRRVQTQNMSRTPKALEPEFWLEAATEAIRQDDYDLLTLLIEEPMDALSGLVRSAIRVPEDFEMRVCDLSSIESVVIGWLADCQPLLNVFREGRDAYIDFACDLYGQPYEVCARKENKQWRTNSKPAVLGCGFRLGGGELSAEGKRTGLWGYAENMGVDLTQAESKKAVEVFREKYVEIVELWYALEDAVRKCLLTKKEQTVGPLKFRYSKPFLVVELPSGRCMHYYKPRIEKKEYHSRDQKTGEYLYNRDGSAKTYTKEVFSYMGKEQNGKRWTRIYSHGGKLVENFVQAIARDILKHGMLAAHKLGFKIVGSVHDEIKTEQRKSNDVLTVARLRECMITGLSWAGDMPLNAAGWAGVFYKKD